VCKDFKEFSFCSGGAGFWRIFFLCETHGKFGRIQSIQNCVLWIVCQSFFTNSMTYDANR